MNLTTQQPPGQVPPPQPTPPYTPPPTEPLAMPGRGSHIHPLGSPHGTFGALYQSHAAPITAHPPPQAAHTPPLPQPPYRRTARISTITSLGETFRFPLIDQVSSEFLRGSPFGSSNEGTSDDDTSSTNSGETSGSDDSWYSGSDDSEDVTSVEVYCTA